MTTHVRVTTTTTTVIAFFFFNEQFEFRFTQDRTVGRLKITFSGRPGISTGNVDGTRVRFGGINESAN